MVKMNEFVHFPGLIIRYRQQEELMLGILRYGAEFRQENYDKLYADD